MKEFFDDVVFCVFCGILFNVDLILFFILIDGLSVVGFNVDNKIIFKFVIEFCRSCESGCLNFLVE